LEVMWRLGWFRERFPNGGIKTELLSLNEDTGLVLVKATIANDDGAILATARGTARDDGQKVRSGNSMENEETSAIGLALAMAGFGTQFSGDEVEEDPNGVDSTVNRTPPPANTPRQPTAPPASVTQAAQNAGGTVAKREKVWTEAEAKVWASRHIGNN